MTKRVTSALLLLGAMAMTACDSGNGTPDLSGNYYGTRTAGPARLFVSARVPKWDHDHGDRVLGFDVVDALASSKVRRYGVRVTHAGAASVEISLGQAGTMAVSLGVPQDACASGASEGWQAHFCWPAGQLNLNLTGPSGETESLRLTRDLTAPAPVAAGATYTVDELVGRAKFVNYAVSEEAERAYRARESIRAARAALLPRLNVKEIVGIFMGDYLSAVGNLLPFIFPSHWFQLQEAKSLAVAEEKSLASLRGNEMNAVQDLCYMVARDQAVAGAVDAELAWMGATHAFLSAEEQAGVLPTGSAAFFGTVENELKLDRVGMATLLTTETAALAQATALPPVGGIGAVAAVDASSIASATPLEAASFTGPATEHALELSSLDALIAAARVGVKEATFSFLDPQGIINLGFDLGTKIAIAKSSVIELQRRRAETASLIEERVADVAAQQNGALSSYSTAKESLSTVNARTQWLIQRHLQGDPTLDDQEFVADLAELRLKAIAFTADRESAQQLYLSAQARLDRLTLAGFYQDLDPKKPEKP
ncbi:MAG TPA: hypothetical protein VL588_13280 [Bdellovibrionota bacterium]|nr:hypothetical protein [Bdellovibrionota bacterium]